MCTLNRLSVLILLGTLACLGPSCSSTTCPDQEPDDGTVFFATSFEADADTVGWRLYGDIEVAEDAPPEGGSRSMAFSGGCIAPHASLALEEAPANGRYKIRFWAKLTLGGGTVWLRTGFAAHQETRIAITSSEWAEYTSTGSVLVRPGETLRIDLLAGGFYPGTAQIDRIEVIELGP